MSDRPDSLPPVPEDTHRRHIAEEAEIEVSELPGLLPCAHDECKRVGASRPVFLVPVRPKGSGPREYAEISFSTLVVCAEHHQPDTAEGALAYIGTDGVERIFNLMSQTHRVLRKYPVLLRHDPVGGEA
jgi:hypothetical protein